MKKLLLLLTIFVAFYADAQIFSYEYDGQTLEYQVISATAKTCRTKPGEALTDGGFKAGNKVSGNLIIPDYAVDSAGVSYKVIQIGNGSFSECEDLKRVIFPDEITSIGEYAFYRCGLTGTLNLPGDLITISAHAFEECHNLTGSLLIPYGVTSIGAGAFGSCRSFNGSLILSDDLTYIGERAFYYCTDFTGPLVIPDGVTYIGANAFYYCCRFEGSLTIPNKVTFIGRCAFGECYRLNGTLTLGSSLKTVGDIPFYGCDFTAIRCFNPIPANHIDGAVDRIFTNSQLKTTLFVPAESILQYKESNFAYGFVNVEPHWLR